MHKTLHDHSLFSIFVAVSMGCFRPQLAAIPRGHAQTESIGKKNILLTHLFLQKAVDLKIL